MGKYCTSEELLENINLYLSGNRSKESHLSWLLYQIAEGVSNTFFNVHDRENAIQGAVCLCFEKLDRFKPDKGKCFNYFTTICFNHFHGLWRTQDNEHKKCHALYKEMLIQLKQDIRHEQ